MPSAALHKHKEAGSALNPNQGCQQREARLITARGPPICADFGSMLITTPAVQIWAFCASACRADGDRGLHPGLTAAGQVSRG